MAPLEQTMRLVNTQQPISGIQWLLELRLRTAPAIISMAISRIGYLQHLATLRRCKHAVESRCIGRAGLLPSYQPDPSSGLQGRDKTM